jgi:hypothetical protein
MTYYSNCHHTSTQNCQFRIHSIRMFANVSIPANVSLCQAKKSTTTSSINLLQSVFWPFTSNASYIPSSFPSDLTHHFPYLQLPIYFQHCKVGLYLTAGFRGFKAPPPPPPNNLGGKKTNSSSWYNIILKNKCQGKEGRKFTYISHTHRSGSLIHNRTTQWTACLRFSHKGLTILYQLQLLLLYCLWSI